MRLQVGDGAAGFGASHHRGAQVAGEQDAADWIVEMEIPFRVRMKCAGRSHSSFRPSGNMPPASGTPITRFSVFPTLVKRGCEARPQAGNDELGLGTGHPAVQRCKDVGIRVRGDQVREMLRREVALDMPM